MPKKKPGPEDIRAALAKEHFIPALKMAASFPHLGEQKDRIMKGWSALNRPAFYRELGQDPDALFQDAIAAVRERYENPKKSS